MAKHQIDLNSLELGCLYGMLSTLEYKGASDTEKEVFESILKKLKLEVDNVMMNRFES